MKEEYSVVTLSDEREYVIVSSAKLEDKNYLYFVDKDDNNSHMICRLEDNCVVKVTDNNLLGKLILLFNEDLKTVFGTN